MNIVIVKGTRFSTPFESGCVALSEPDKFGSFDAYDSEGVICTFSVRMVKRIEDSSCGLDDVDGESS